MTLNVRWDVLLMKTPITSLNCVKCSENGDNVSEELMRKTKWRIEMTGLEEAHFMSLLNAVNAVKLLFSNCPNT
jgi:hypothetical protein